MSQSTELQLTSSMFKANPYPIFARLRSDDPIHRLSTTDGQSVWLITRYQDAELVLRDERFVKDKQNLLPPEERTSLLHQPASVADLFGLGMLKFDPPDHTRLRTLVSSSFTPRHIEQWRGRIQEITDELIDNVAMKGQMDLMEEFAFPLPIRVVSEMLGVASQDAPRLHQWIKQITDALDDPGTFECIEEQLQFCYEYLQVLIEQKRQQPAADLVSQLIEAEHKGDRLNERELVAMIFLLILAGYETTANLIGNGMLALLTHAEQMERLRQNPDLIKTAVEEFLRYHSPFTISTWRWARENIQLGNTAIRQGDEIIVSLSSANHDQTTFTRPDILDITRQHNPHLSFSKGVHYCLGAPLGRLEGQIAINTLLSRLPDLQLQVHPDQLIWRPGSTVMGVYHLPVTFSTSQQTTVREETRKMEGNNP